MWISPILVYTRLDEQWCGLVRFWFILVSQYIYGGLFCDGKLLYDERSPVINWSNKQFPRLDEQWCGLVRFWFILVSQYIYGGLFCDGKILYDERSPVINWTNKQFPRLDEQWCGLVRFWFILVSQYIYMEECFVTGSSCMTSVLLSLIGLISSSRGYTSSGVD